MPPLARRFLKTAFLFGALGIMTGMHISSALHLQAGDTHRYYISAHTHLVLVGFVLMMCMAGLLWKLPPAPEGSRYKPGLMPVVYWLLVSCTLGRYLLESGIGYMEPEPDWLHQLIFYVSCLQGLAVITFFVNLWPRLSGPEA
jgi:heme/copper-type cytochrome/quinol oxidase subunit 1